MIEPAMSCSSFSRGIQSSSVQFQTFLRWCLLLPLLAAFIGCHQEKGQGSPSLARSQPQQQVSANTPILDDAELQGMLSDVAKLKKAWAAEDDNKVQEICGIPNLGVNLYSKGFVARKALASTSQPEVLLQYKIARVPILETQNSLVYATYISTGGPWSFLNFASDPKFASTAFGPVTKDSDETKVLIEATDRAIKRIQASGSASDNSGLNEVPFFAATQRITQPNVRDLVSALKNWNRQPHDIRICRRVYIEVAVGEEAAYTDRPIGNDSAQQTVVLGFSDWNGKLCCVEGLRELRLVLKPSDTAGLDANEFKANEKTARLITRLFSASDLSAGFAEVNGFSSEQKAAVVPFAMKAYQQRQQVYKNESRIEIAKLLGACGEHSRAALPLLADELDARVLANSKPLFDVTLDAMSQIVGDSAVIKQLRATQDVDAWQALAKLFKCDRILDEDDFERLVELLETDDLQMLESKVNEMATGRVSRWKRKDIQAALAFLKK